jgi:DNA mismatch repair protein MutL
MAAVYSLVQISDVIVIDQRAAHERIIFESLMKILANQAVLPFKKLLWPETIQSHASDTVLMKDILPHLQYLGFDMLNLDMEASSCTGFPLSLLI